MGIFYVRSSGGNDNNDASTWALSKATITGALLVATGNDTVYVSHNHSETGGASLTFATSGTPSVPIKIICVNDTSEPPISLATTATLTTTGNTNITFGGFAVINGITFSIGSVGNNNAVSIQFGNTSPWWYRAENCVFKINTTNNVGPDINIGQRSLSIDDGKLECINCSFGVGNVGHGIIVRAPFEWSNTTGSGVVGSILPNSLFISPVDSPPYGDAEIVGVNLITLGSGQSLVSGGPRYSKYIFRNCKLGSGVNTLGGVNPGPGGPGVRLINCDSSDTNNRYEKNVYQGVITQELSVVRIGGSTDGSIDIGRKMVSSTGSNVYSPLYTDWITSYNTSLFPQNVIAEVLTDNVTLTDADAWVEVEYLGTSGFPLSVFTSDKVALPFGTGINQTTSNANWLTPGISTPVKQQLAVNFVPVKIGPIRARVALSKTSTTMYLDPKLFNNSGRQFTTDFNYINEIGHILPGMAGGIIR